MKLRLRDDGGLIFTDCDKCAELYADSSSALTHAAASVGIEHGMTTGECLYFYIRLVHKRDHLACVSGCRANMDAGLHSEGCIT